MKVSATGKETTIIEFSKEELEACQLTYENISRNVIKSKTAIYTIISETAKISGNERVIDENTVIDILPDGEGGCVIILNNVPAPKAEKERAIFFASTADCFFDLARAVSPDSVKSSNFYRTDEGYALYVEGESRVLNRCSEFCDSFYCEDIHSERLKEYGELLIENNALEILCGTASEK